jgi:hypothetical protein
MHGKSREGMRVASVFLLRANLQKISCYSVFSSQMLIADLKSLIIPNMNLPTLIASQCASHLSVWGFWTIYITHENVGTREALPSQSFRVQTPDKDWTVVDLGYFDDEGKLA